MPEKQKTDILLDIMARIGEMSADVREIKVVGIATHEQAKKTNGRVTRLENDIIPNISDQLNKKAESSECRAHSKALDSTKEDLNIKMNKVDVKTKPLQWLVEKPVRVLALIGTIIFINKMTPDFNYDQFMEFIKAIL